MEPFTNLKRVAVVGAGPAGLAAVKYELLDYLRDLLTQLAI